MAQKIDFTKLTWAELLAVDSFGLSPTIFKRLIDERKSRIPNLSNAELGNVYRMDNMLIHRVQVVREMAKRQNCHENDIFGKSHSRNARNEFRQAEKLQWGGDKSERKYRLLLGTLVKDYETLKTLGSGIYPHASRTVGSIVFNNDCVMYHAISNHQDSQKVLHTNFDYVGNTPSIEFSHKIENTTYPYKGKRYSKFPKTDTKYHYNVLIPTRKHLHRNNFDGIQHIMTDFDGSKLAGCWERKQGEREYQIANTGVYEREDIFVTKTCWLEGCREKLHVVNGYIASNKVVTQESGNYWEYVFAHGKTEKAAVSALKAKLTKRYDEMHGKVKTIKPETVITKTKFHNLTGACNAGIRAFCNTHEIRAERMTAREVIAMLRDKNQTMWADKLEQVISQ